LLQLIKHEEEKLLKAKVGDKVRLKEGAYSGERALIESFDGDTLLVRLEKTGRSLLVRPEDVTNFSLAARKAWKTEPGRRVGRRKGTRLSDRVSVTLRIDRDLWERFKEMEAGGLIDDRTAAINAWLREKMGELERSPRRAGPGA
jgi:uncharacterized protein (DUF4415 family)